MRLAAANALALYGNDQMIKQGLIRSLQQQKSPLLQVELIGILVNIKDKTSDSYGRQPRIERNLLLDGHRPRKADQPVAPEDGPEDGRIVQVRAGLVKRPEDWKRSSSKMTGSDSMLAAPS